MVKSTATSNLTSSATPQGLKDHRRELRCMMTDVFPWLSTFIVKVQHQEMSSYRGDTDKRATAGETQEKLMTGTRGIRWSWSVCSALFSYHTAQTLVLRNITDKYTNCIKTKVQTAEETVISIKFHPQAQPTLTFAKTWWNEQVGVNTSNLFF